MKKTKASTLSILPDESAIITMIFFILLIVEIVLSGLKALKDLSAPTKLDLIVVNSMQAEITTMKSKTFQPVDLR